MKYKIYIIILLIIGFLILFAGYFCWIRKDKVIISTYKKEYLQTKVHGNIEIKIVNLYKYTIYYWAPRRCREDEIFIKNSWEKIESAKSCKAGSPKTSMGLGLWKEIESGKTAKVNVGRIHKAGIHRIGIHFYMGELEKLDNFDEEKVKVFYSNKFFYKECEIDSDCLWKAGILSCSPTFSKCINNSCKVGCKPYSGDTILKEK